VSGRLEQRSWENEQGEKRTIVEIVADDVAASFRFATAEVHRVERSGPSGSGPANIDLAGGGNARPAPAPVSSGAAATGSGYDEYGEEPF
jgi:single-strand DNA-binding protein